MEYEMDKKVLEGAIELYGEHVQHDMLLEEMAELQKEICKNYRDKRNENAIIEEIADVLIMIEQVKMMHEIKDSYIQDVIHMKLSRMKRLIKKEIEFERILSGCKFDE